MRSEHLGLAHTKETGHRNAAAISKQCHLFWAGIQLPN